MLRDRDPAGVGIAGDPCSVHKTGNPAGEVRRTGAGYVIP